MAIFRTKQAGTPVAKRGSEAPREPRNLTLKISPGNTPRNASDQQRSNLPFQPQVVALADSGNSQPAGLLHFRALHFLRLFSCAGAWFVCGPGNHQRRGLAWLARN